MLIWAQHSGLLVIPALLVHGQLAGDNKIQMTVPITEIVMPHWMESWRHTVIVWLVSLCVCYSAGICKWETHTKCHLMHKWLFFLLKNLFYNYGMACSPWKPLSELGLCWGFRIYQRQTCSQQTAFQLGNSTCTTKKNDKSRWNLKNN